MSDLITLYHGTNSLREILRAGAIWASSRLDGGEMAWSVAKQEYDDLTKRLVGIAKQDFEESYPIDWFRGFTEETIADLAQRHLTPSASSDDLRLYKELKRRLCVYLTTDFGQAKNYLSEAGSILEVSISTELLRQGLLRVEENRVQEVEKEVPLGFLHRVFVFPRVLRQTRRLLNLQGYQSVLLERL